MDHAHIKLHHIGINVFIVRFFSALQCVLYYICQIKKHKKLCIFNKLLVAYTYKSSNIFFSLNR